MPRENALTAAAARLAGIPFRLLADRRPFEPPRKALILKPCCLSQVMLATPLLGALKAAYPRAQFDWAVSEWARPAVATNPQVAEIIDTGRVGLAGGRRADVQPLITRLRREQYDTCFIPARSSLLSYIAWRAGIPQRVGLDAGGRGFAHTMAVPVAGQSQHEALIYLSLAEALGIEAEPHMSFHPTDRNRTRATALLVDEIEWLGDVPLVLIHPGGGSNPVQPETSKRWPAERFALLGSRLSRERGARLLLVGGEEDRPLVEAVAGMLTATASNLAGCLTLGELGALCEMADLYIGNDAGPTHVAAAVGCATLAIFGPSDPAVSGPFATKGRVLTVCPADVGQPFSWAHGPTLDEALDAAGELLDDGRRPVDR
jgi:heptosyltransferase II